MANDIGFFLCKLNNCPEHNHILSTMNDWIKNNPYNQCVVFNSFCENINIHKVPILHLSHAKFFYGDLMVFDFVSLILASHFPNIKNLYYYMSNIAWDNSLNSRYIEWEEAFSAPHLKVIASNQTIYDVYEIAWKKPCGISENFTYEQLSKIIQ